MSFAHLARSMDDDGVDFYEFLDDPEDAGDGDDDSGKGKKENENSEKKKKGIFGRLFHRLDCNSDNQSNAVRRLTRIFALFSTCSHKQLQKELISTPTNNTQNVHLSCPCTRELEADDVSVSSHFRHERICLAIETKSALGCAMQT